MSFLSEYWGTLQHLSMCFVVSWVGCLSLMKFPQWFSFGLPSKSLEHLELRTFSTDAMFFVVALSPIVHSFVHGRRISVLFGVPVNKLCYAFFEGDFRVES
jgi:hypothetical protein